MKNEVRVAKMLEKCGLGWIEGHTLDGQLRNIKYKHLRGKVK